MTKVQMKIYVASSWRNDLQPNVVSDLRSAGHEVYDFRNPSTGDKGFHWSDINPGWQTWGHIEYLAGLNHHLAESGFRNDYKGMVWADVCVLVLPCGRSAHLEAGWFVGVSKRLYILADPSEPELMYKLADGIFDRLDLLILQLAKVALDISNE